MMKDESLFLSTLIASRTEFFISENQRYSASKKDFVQQRKSY
jgi:hypothetical protein